MMNLKSLIVRPKPKQDRFALYRGAQRVILLTLRSYGIHLWPARLSSACETPRVVRLPFAPPAGVRLSAIEARSREIGLALGLERPDRVRVVATRGLIFVEVPRPGKWEVVRLGDVLRDLEAARTELRPGDAVLGKVGNHPLVLRLPSPEVAHVLVAGTTGAGKTELTRTMIVSLAVGAGPEALRLVLVDPKNRAYHGFADFPHLLCPVVVEPADAEAVLLWLVSLMEDRDRRRECLPLVVVFVDELVDLVMAAGSGFERAMVRLVQRGREAGIHVVACTQRPSVDAVKGLLKANFPTRVVFAVTSSTDAKVAAGVSGTGAERLLGRGDGLLCAGGRVLRFQAALVGGADLARVEGRVPGRGSVLVSLDAIRRAVEVAGAEGAGGKDDALAARIRELAARGLSRRQIEEEVFGYTGGAAYQKVREILGEEER